MFYYTFKFIYDLITINNEILEKNILNIYPAELELKKGKQVYESPNFLDIKIEI